MKNRNKMILSAFLALTPIAIATPLILTSCKNDNSSEQDSLSSTYQYDYAKNISLLLGDNVVTTPTSTKQSYLSFKDAKTNAWYVLMRDTNNNNDRIIASFCGWDINYYKTADGITLINGTYSIPETISIPTGYNLNIKNINTNEIPVESIGISYNMIKNDYLNVDVLFPNIEDKYHSNSPYLPIANNLDLQDNNIKYIFEKASFSFNDNRTNKENSKIIFPKNLVYIQEMTSFGSDSTFENLELDFSLSNLVEIVEISVTINNNLKIKLSPTCIRISNIIFSHTLEINLENVLYYSDNAFIICNFPNNTVKINKKAEYFETTFKEGTIIEFFE